MFSDGVFDYCNVTFAYTHSGRGDQVLVTYWLPTPHTFQSRYLSTGGGGLAINSGTTSSGSLLGGIIYGAVAGATDGGFGSFDTQFDAVFLLANGTINWESVFMSGYEAHHEMSAIERSSPNNFSTCPIPSSSRATRHAPRAAVKDGVRSSGMQMSGMVLLLELPHSVSPSSKSNISTPASLNKPWVTTLLSASWKRSSTRPSQRAILWMVRPTA
jgi:hypothetical protein